MQDAIQDIRDEIMADPNEDAKPENWQDDSDDDSNGDDIMSDIRDQIFHLSAGKW